MKKGTLDKLDTDWRENTSLRYTFHTETDVDFFLNWEFRHFEKIPTSFQ